jgi:hypothetical protein
MKGYDGANPIEILRSFLEISLGSADSVFDRFLEPPGAICRGENPAEKLEIIIENALYSKV